MPIKYSKEASSRLFRYVKQIDISFNPYDKRAKSAREMWRQLNAARFKKANPSLQIKTMVNSSPKAPFVNFTLHDDTQKAYDSQQYKADEILFDLHLTLDTMDNEYEMAGKSIDD